ncbi:uncharacterized protein MONOS_16512 [Monocercomonoides exilis]|uniref:uncharacterized protein n=1 Tax=Monocercomonoides exilis TaxID=2049356 RepID=UPI0035599564|nr:hypothetical protein MONOS_16512 [Monocercomonoides exilis]|eukprot:MONOS_16512.1-p1 / transcript=MONOS_16512.1 / gene=MONOS_16512 / organism=Monocercomonoides_exilis_PA203 / gene_product=unspecified product / transcript_product=unspecified product / location=Mono_scaffold01803:3553-4036(-) / protein_length=137 / sequence_SO=supercontig / SO=protein_coding / is_pseudo=false
MPCSATSCAADPPDVIFIVFVIFIIFVIFPSFTPASDTSAVSAVSLASPSIAGAKSCISPVDSVNEKAPNKRSLVNAGAEVPMEGDGKARAGGEEVFGMPLQLPFVLCVLLAVLSGASSGSGEAPLANAALVLFLR